MAAAAEKIGKADLDVESILDEAYKVPGGMDIFSGLSFGGDVIPDYNKMYREQATLIRKLAQLSGGVFLGRCADAVLADQKDWQSWQNLQMNTKTSQPWHSPIFSRHSRQPSENVQRFGCRSSVWISKIWTMYLEA